jgi:hypothetical protein
VSTQPGRSEPGPAIWQRAPEGDLARTAFFLLVLWAISVFAWVAPDFLDQNTATTTLPLPSLLLGIAGVLALSAAVFVGLLAVSTSGRLRAVRAVLYVAVAVGAVLTCLDLVGVNVSASSSPDRRSHALAACAVVVGALVVARLLLGAMRPKPNPQQTW